MIMLPELLLFFIRTQSTQKKIYIKQYTQKVNKRTCIDCTEVKVCDRYYNINPADKGRIFT